MGTAKVRKLKPYSGFTNKTLDNMLLDAGVFFENYDIETDTYASAKAAGKCLGVTIKGGEFSAKPTIRNIEFDGVRSRIKGNAFIDNWETYLKATVAEVTEGNIRKALGASEVDEETLTGYHGITGRSYVLDSDYCKNITWIGCLLGKDKPVIIQIFNGLNEGGLTMGVADKDNGKFDVQFYGYSDETAYDSEDVKPPFVIWEPVAEEG